MGCPNDYRTIDRTRGKEFGIVCGQKGTSEEPWVFGGLLTLVRALLAEGSVSTI